MTAQQAIRQGMEMAEQAGTTLLGYGRCLEYSKKIPSDTFDLGRSILNRPRTAAEQVRPDGLDMTCQEHRIRELVTVGMPDADAWRWSGPVWSKYIPTNLTTADQT